MPAQPVPAGKSNKALHRQALAARWVFKQFFRPKIMTTVYHQLDNPVWHSLGETHRAFALEWGDARFYRPGYCPFGGLAGPGTAALAAYARQADSFYVVGERPLFGAGLRLHRELVCLQMLLDKTVHTEAAEAIVPLQAGDRAALYRLVNTVQPGYFKEETAALGSYYGIFRQGQLVAVTGERMKMHACTEVSAVVTHPAHTGKGYARQLVAHTANRVLQEDKLPYLHVAETNTVAIRLYEKLGFRTRRRISFWHLVRNDRPSAG